MLCDECTSLVLYYMYGLLIQSYHYWRENYQSHTFLIFLEFNCIFTEIYVIFDTESRDSYHRFTVIYCIFTVSTVNAQQN